MPGKLVYCHNRPLEYNRSHEESYVRKRLKQVGCVTVRKISYGIIYFKIMVNIKCLCYDL